MDGAREDTDPTGRLPDILQDETKHEDSMLPLQKKVSLVTGASRGIGAATALKLAAMGSDLILNYRSKGARAEKVREEITRLGRISVPMQADLTVESEVRAMMAQILDRFQRLDILVLNASGGMEKGKADGYAMDLNQTAQVNTANLAVSMMPRGGRIVFVTSHWAHFFGQHPVIPPYEVVAKSKHAGEKALRNAIPEWNQAGISLAVVSGDAIEGTITPRLLERMSPGLLKSRGSLDSGKEHRSLPTVEEFAEVIARTAADRTLPTGHTVLVGNVED